LFLNARGCVNLFIGEGLRENIVNSRRKANTKQAALLGVAFDADDEQTRVTRGDNFVLWGGSPETHQQMQETAIKMNQELDKRGKQLGEVSVAELRDILDAVIR
jgi:hypothetical protein